MIEHRDGDADSHTDSSGLDRDSDAQSHSKSTFTEESLLETEPTSEESSFSEIAKARINAAFDEAAESLGQAKDFVGRGVSATSSALSQAANSITSNVDSLLSSLSTDPDEESTFFKSAAKEIFEMLPLFGQAPAYANARQKLLLGEKNGDQNLVDEGLKDGLYICLNIGLDVGFFGVWAAKKKGVSVAGRLARGTAFAGTVSTAYKLGLKRVNDVPGVKVEPGKVVIDQMLKSETVRNFSHYFLTRVPSSQSNEAQEESPEDKVGNE